MPSAQPLPARAIRVRDKASNIAIGRDVAQVAAACIPLLPATGGPSRREAARACWELLKYHVRYKAETDDQMVRTPWRTLEDGVADCKSQAVLIASVCGRAGCDVALRYVQYAGEDWYGHVYAVVDGKVVDPLLDFGEECTYIRCETVPIHG